jgi:hypothetical protein
MTSLINRAFESALADPRPRTIRDLRDELQNPVRDRRLLALVRIRRQIERDGVRRGYFSLVEPLTLDPDSNCRWQATIIIGEFIETHPDKVWRVARALGRSAKADIRMAASTVLLEHLLERYPSRMGSLFKKELKRQDHRFASAISSCGNFGKTSAAKREIQRVIDLAKERSHKGMQPTARKMRRV